MLNMYSRPRNPAELLKVHLKHYHLNNSKIGGLFRPTFQRGVDQTRFLCWAEGLGLHCESLGQTCFWSVKNFRIRIVDVEVDRMSDCPEAAVRKKAFLAVHFPLKSKYFQGEPISVWPNAGSKKLSKCFQKMPK